MHVIVVHKMAVIMGGGGGVRFVGGFGKGGELCRKQEMGYQWGLGGEVGKNRS